MAHDESNWYPSAWFDANAPRKPSIEIPAFQGTLENLRDTVSQGLRDHMLDIRIAKRYLWDIFSQVQDNGWCPPLREPWVSFGRIICDTDNTPVIGNLFDVKITNENMTFLTTNTTSAETDTSLVIYLCSIHRIINLASEKSRKNVIKKVERLLPNDFKREFDLTHIYTHYQHWKKDKNYRILMAGIDMLLIKYSKHKHRLARIGTVVTRHKDCGAIMDLSFISEITDKRFPSLARWIWNEELANEFDRVQWNLPRNEIYSHYYSYMPYFMEMGLSEKSPYSHATNPHLHVWVNVVGASIGYKRSVDEYFKAPSSINTDAIISQAAVFSYSLNTVLELCSQYSDDGVPEAIDELPKIDWNGYGSLMTPELGSKYSETGEIEEDPVDQEPLSLAPLETPKNSNGDYWLRWLLHNGGKVKNPVRSYIRRIWGNLSTARRNTFGKVLSEFKL